MNIRNTCKHENKSRQNCYDCGSITYNKVNYFI